MILIFRFFFSNDPIKPREKTTTIWRQNKERYTIRNRGVIQNTFHAVEHVITVYKTSIMFTFNYGVNCYQENSGLGKEQCREDIGQLVLER